MSKTKSIDTIALGTCYVDTNLSDYPFEETGISVESELIGENYELIAGGSAVNFCRLVGEFGLKAAFIGMAGDDQNGKTLEDLLVKDNVEALLIRTPELLTNISFNMTNSNGEHIMLVAGTANAALGPEVVLLQLESALATAKTLYLGGCFKLKSLAPSFTQITELARQHGAATIVDHGRIPKNSSSETTDAVKRLVLGSDYYLPSREEFCQLWGVETIEEGLEMLHAQAAELQTVVKDGANGAFYWSNNTLQHVPAPKIAKVVQATGAGDSFNAGFMAALIQGSPMKTAIEYGCKVGAAKVAGASIPTLEA